MQGTVRLGSPVRSAVLTALLLRDGQALSISELSEMLWETPPRSALANVRSHLTALRRDLDEASPGASRRLSTHRGTQCSYRLEVAPEELDLSAFRRATHRGRTLLQAGDAEAAITVLEEALALWRGPFGQDLPPTRWFNNHVAGVNSIRFCAYQDLFTAYV